MNETAELWRLVLEKTWSSVYSEVDAHERLVIKESFRGGFVLRVAHVRGGEVFVVDPRVALKGEFDEPLTDRAVQYYEVNVGNFSLEELERRLHSQIDQTLQRVSADPQIIDWSAFHSTLQTAYPNLAIESPNASKFVLNVRHSSQTQLLVIAWFAPELAKLVTSARREDIAFLIVDPTTTPHSAVMEHLILAWVDQRLRSGEEPALFSELYIGLERAGFGVEAPQLRRLLGGSALRYHRDAQGLFTLASPSDLATEALAPEQEPAIEPEELRPTESIDIEPEVGVAVELLVGEAELAVDPDPDPEETLPAEDALLRELVVLLFEVARADEKFLPEEKEAMTAFFEGGLVLSERSSEKVKEICAQEAQTERVKELEPVELLKLPEPVRDLVLRAAFEIAQADFEYHQKEKRALERISQRLRVSPDLLSFLEIEFSTTHDPVECKLAILGLTTPVQQVDLDASYARLVHRYEPVYFGSFSAVFGELAQKFRSLLEERYNQLTRYLPTFFERQRYKVFDHPIRQVVSDGRCKAILEENGIKTLSQLFSRDPADVKNLEGVGTSTWRKLHQNVHGYARKFSVLRPAVQAFFTRGESYVLDSSLVRNDVLKEPLAALLVSERIIASLSRRNLSTILDLIQVEGTDLSDQLGLMPREWLELKSALLHVVDKSVWRSNVEKFIAAVENLHENGVKSVVTNTLLKHGVLSSRGLVQRVRAHTPKLSEEQIFSALEALCGTGSIFCLRNKRYALAQDLEVNSETTEAVRQLAFKHLANSPSLSCLDCTWRSGYSNLSVDQIDYALGSASELERGADDQYRLSKITASDAEGPGTNSVLRLPIHDVIKSPQLAQKMEDSGLTTLAEVLSRPPGSIYRTPGMKLKQFERLKAELRDFSCTPRAEPVRTQIEAYLEHGRALAVEPEEPCLQLGDSGRAIYDDVQVKIVTAADRLVGELTTSGMFARREELECERYPELGEFVYSDDRLTVVSCFWEFIGLKGWGEDVLVDSLSHNWPLIKRKLREFLEDERTDSLSEEILPTLIQVAEQKRSPQIAGRLKARLGDTDQSSLLERARDRLLDIGKPLFFGSVCRFLAVDKADYDAFGKALAEHPDFQLYPFAANKWLGLTEWGQAARESVVRECWPWIRIDLEDGQLGSLPNYSAEEWQAVAAVAVEQGSSGLVPEEFRIESTAPATQSDLLVHQQLFEKGAGEELGDVEPLVESNGSELILDILNRATKAKKPFSVAELQVTEAEYSQLQNWAQTMSATELGEWFENDRQRMRVAGDAWTKAEIFGFFLLVYLAEVARRKAVEGNLWSNLSGAFGDRIRKRLFAGSYARSSTREWLEEATKKIGARHAYGQEGTQDSYITILLQVGFTRKGMVRLPMWLSEGVNKPRSIELLCAGNNSFSRMWHELQSFRRGQRPRSEMREILQACPFVMDSWVEPVMEAAKAVRGSQGSFSVQSEAFEEESPLDGPFLEWEVGGAPSLSAVIQTGALNLCDFGYSVVVNDELRARLIRNQSGEYSAEPDARISLEVGLEESSLVLVGDESDDTLVLSIRHFPADAAFTAFSIKDGRVTEIEDLASNDPAVLLCPTDHAVDGRLQEYELELLEKKLVYFEKGIELYDSVFDSEECESPEEEFATLGNLTVGCFDRGLRLGQPFEISVQGLPVEAEIKWARVGGKSLEVQRVPGGFLLKSLLSPQIAKRRIRVELAISLNGQTQKVERRTTLDFLGVTMLDGGHWVACNSEVSLASQEAASRPFRFMIADGSYDQWALMEGDVFSRRPAAKPDGIQNLGGFGAPLYLRKGPYNIQGEGLCLARQVVHRGLFSGCFVSGESVHFWLNREVKADADFELQFWNPGKPLVRLPLSQARKASEGCWEIRLPEGNERYSLVMALSYSGERLGGWWTDDFYLPSQVDNPELTAQLCRYFHLPLLSEDFLPQVQDFAKNYPGETLRSWIHATEVEQHGLILPSDTDEWFSVVRRVFVGIHDRWDKAWRSLVAVVGDSKECFNSVLKVHPVMAYKMLSGCASCANEDGIKWLLGTEAVRCERERTKLIERSLVQAAKETETDRNFVKRNAEKILDDLSQGRRLEMAFKQNFDVLCNRPAFRRYFATQCFQRWSKK